MGRLVKMDLIVAGTNPLATDMVASRVMGFETEEIPTFSTALNLGMYPGRLDEIEIRGENVENVKRDFIKPNVVPWTAINKSWGVQEI
jgi:uncharacterized protein (DUF362 family)